LFGEDAVDNRAMAVPVGDRDLSRQGIAWRLALALGAVFLMIAAVSVACLIAIFDIHDRLHVLKNDEERARGVVRLASAVRDQYAHVAHTIIIGNESHAGLFRQATQRLEAIAATLRGHGGPGDDTEIDRIVRASQEIDQLFETQILPLVHAGDHATLIVKHDRIMSLAFQAQDEAENLAKKAEASMEDLNRHVHATQHGAILTTVIAHVLSLLTAVLVGLYLYRTIARPIAALSSAASRMGAGDLDSEIGIERDDELGRLSRRFNDLMRSTKENQKRLIQTERMVNLASMSAGIAHELNNPIGVIVGYAKLLRRRPEAPDPKVFVAIEEEAERCQQIIEGLLALTRGGTLSIGPVDLLALATEVVGRLRELRVPPGVAIEIHGHGAVHGDVAKLRQVVTNLVANALDACDMQGRIVVLVDEPNPGVATIEVHDSGAGIAPDVQDRIFEPYFTTKPAGSGLGLAISRAIAHAHGGDVILVSTGPRGTTFRLTLPRKAAAI
jgi:signal transduction histidine kinase